MCILFCDFVNKVNNGKNEQREKEKEKEREREREEGEWKSRRVQYKIYTFKQNN